MSWFFNLGSEIESFFELTFSITFIVIPYSQVEVNNWEYDNNGWRLKSSCVIDNTRWDFMLNNYHDNSCPMYTCEVEDLEIKSLKKWSFSLVGASLLLTRVHSSHFTSSWRLLRNMENCSYFVDPKPMSLQACFGLSWISLCIRLNSICFLEIQIIFSLTWQDDGGPKFHLSWCTWPSLASLGSLPKWLLENQPQIRGGM